jgi:hypothetical protein
MRGLQGKYRRESHSKDLLKIMLDIWKKCGIMGIDPGAGG